MNDVTLGIHLGHHASCAVVINGELKAALQQERISRRKHDGGPFFHNGLPVQQCLAAAGVTLQEVSAIVSSLQAVAPGGVGLRAPLVQPGFNLFDPWDGRHRVISHHLAHAICAYGCSGFRDAMVLVADLAGSATLDGFDFTMPFTAFYDWVIPLDHTIRTQSEVMSIYQFDRDGPKLLEREYCIPHPAPDVFIQSVASLYDNVSRSVFGTENAHGQLMALASLPLIDGSAKLNASEMVSISGGPRVKFLNSWQSTITINPTVLNNVRVAQAVQKALQQVLLAYATRARNLGSSKNFAAAGGVFLNILANSDIANSGLFKRCYFPSSPHDAGIAIGCAFQGQAIWKRPTTLYTRTYVTDRLGTMPNERDIEAALAVASPFVRKVGNVNAEQVATMLVNGQILARCAGRSEFGPRALGGRSLLASPLLASSKDRLNRIKHRQNWRPVAPIILSDRISEFFDGPMISPYMNHVHIIRPQYRQELAALAHPDGSTRAQTLTEQEDEELHAIIAAFARMTGYPILVNTSLNGAGEPIVETASEAIAFFRASPDIDVLLLNNGKILRDQESWLDETHRCRRVHMAAGTILSLIFPKKDRYGVILRGRQSLELNEQLINLFSNPMQEMTLGLLLDALPDKNPESISLLYQAFNQGMIELGDPA